MSRIISSKVSPEAEKEVVCLGCGATIGYTKNDIKIRNGKDMSGGPDGDESIQCPKCNNKITLRSW